MLIIGHRGAAGLAPENTLDAFRAGYNAGADILELDVRITKDGVPVVIHDATTWRTHGTRVVIAYHTYAEIVALNLAPHIPSLKEVLDEFFGTVMLNIELKSKGSGDAVVALLNERYIKRRSDWSNILITSFRTHELIAVRQLSKHAGLGMLHNQNPFLFIAYQRQLHLAAVGFHRLYTHALAIEIAKRLGIFTYAYTVDRIGGMLLLDRRGIDGVVTNMPDRLITAVDTPA